MFRIYKQATGRDYPYGPLDEGQLFSPEDIVLLKEIASDNGSADDLHYQLVRNLLNIERSYSTASRRVGIYENLEKAIINGGFNNENEALEFAEMRAENIEEAEESTQRIIDANGIYHIVEDEKEVGEQF